MTLRVRRIALPVVISAGMLGAVCSCSAASTTKPSGSLPTTQARVEQPAPADPATRAEPARAPSTSPTASDLGGPSSAELSNLDSSINGALTSGQTADTPALSN